MSAGDNPQPPPLPVEEKPDIVGITIATPDMLEMATEAVSRFMNFTGYPARLLAFPQTNGIVRASDAFAHTLDLPDIVGPKSKTTYVFFDADWWLLHHVDLAPFHDQEAVIGVNDPTTRMNTHFPAQDCLTLRLTSHLYLNTGFLIVNRRHWGAYRRAKKMMLNGFQEKTADYSEQTALNVAFQHGGYAIAPIHQRWNFFPYSVSIGCAPICQHPIAIHAAGEGGGGDRGHVKHEKLKRWAGYYQTLYGQTRYQHGLANDIDLLRIGGAGEKDPD